MEIKGKTVIVTGAARGIGRAIAQAFAAAGANVAAADLGSLAAAPGSDWHYALSEGKTIWRGRRAKSAKAAAPAGRSKSMLRTAPLARTWSIARLRHSAVWIFWSMAPASSNWEAWKILPRSDWDRIFAVNAKGVFLLSQAAIPWLEKEGGVIINIASNAGKRGSAYNSAYCASKAAVIGLTQSLAAELAEHGIRVNAICPGAVFTSMQYDYLVQHRLQQYPGQSYEEAFAAFVKDTVPLSRQQRPEEIADAALYLCRADGVTGVSLSVDGGNGIGVS